ncbi:hypothetical protein OG225_20605 [Nocardia sp. NBC_01377]
MTVVGFRAIAVHALTALEGWTRPCGTGALTVRAVPRKHLGGAANE